MLKPHDDRAAENSQPRHRGRREFLRAAGLGGMAIALPSILQACRDGSATGPGTSLLSGRRDSKATEASVTLDLSNDIGVLNYAYALEQLEARFYYLADEEPANDLMPGDRQVLRDLRLHEQTHRDFLAVALGAAAIPHLTFDFSSVDFTSRASVLGTARVFEDLGVAAYNGAGQLLSNPDYLTVAGKIVSVEARHAAAIRDLLQPMSRYFAGDDVVDMNGLDRAFDPATVLAAADPFIVNSITVAG